MHPKYGVRVYTLLGMRRSPFPEQRRGKHEQKRSIAYAQLARVPEDCSTDPHSMLCEWPGEEPGPGCWPRMLLADSQKAVQVVFPPIPGPSGQLSGVCDVDPVTVNVLPAGYNRDINVQLCSAHRSLLAHAHVRVLSGTFQLYASPQQLCRGRAGRSPGRLPISEL